MDNLTHSLFGLTLARTPLGRAGRGATAALVIASNIPDIDIIATVGGASRYLAWHRGPTHGPLGVVGLGLLSAGIVKGVQRLNPRWPDEDRDASFAMLATISMIGVVCHVLMDLPTVYGTRFLSPFSWRWFAVDWMPIFDVYLLVVLGAGLLFGRSSPAARRRNATIALVLMTANYGLRAASHQQALRLAPRIFGPTLPAPCDLNSAWPRPYETWPRGAPTVPASGKRCLVDMAAMPTFLSPFSWRIIAQMSNAYELHDLDLLDGRFRAPASETEVFWRRSLRYPNVWTPAIDTASTTRLGQIFLGFSRFPAARAATDPQGMLLVRFTDMRFVGGPLASDQPGTRIQPFTATIRIDALGRTVSERLGQ